MIPDRPFPFIASRKELRNVALHVLEGAVPDDWYGYVFLNTAAGTVNSDGLPYKRMLPNGQPNQEYASPLINGDGYVIRFDFNHGGQVVVNTALLCPPCYHADVATSPLCNPADNRFWRYAFRSFGLARISPLLGTRNQLNTAFLPFRLQDNEWRMLATFDAGRPFEIDPATLECITPIGENTFWHSGLPPFMRQPFEMVLTTAHPVYDPETREVFSVNFTKTTKALMQATTIFAWNLETLDELEEELERKVEGWLNRDIEIDLVEEVEEALHKIRKAIEKRPAVSRWLHKLQNWWYRLVGHLYSNRNKVYLVRWTGQKRPEAWEVTDQQGRSIEIRHNMHQLGFSKDYLVLGDTNFKFSFDIMLNNPFPHNPKIDAFFRKLLSGVMADYSTVYLIDRRTLKPGAKKVKAKRVRIPSETVHFSVNYDNPEGKVTIHTAHNCSACPAEWLRPYDTEKISGKPVKEELYGLIAVGQMDIGKIGKCVIDAEKGVFLEEESRFLHIEEDPTGAHTWAVGLYTYRDMLSPEKNVEDIRYVYWQSYGLSQERLTSFIYELYDSPERQRLLPVEDILEKTKQGAPFVLFCVDTGQMKAVDAYCFDEGTYMWSLQFVPRREPTPGLHPQQDGYILCTVLPYREGRYTSEIWIFDAAKLAQGPIARLGHPELLFGFTIHSVWVPEANEVTNPPYCLDIKSDYLPMLKGIKRRKHRQAITQLFEEYVFPHEYGKRKR